MKRYRCEVRKRMIIPALSKGEARKKFVELCENMDMEPKVRQVTQEEMIHRAEKRWAKKKAKTNQVK